MNIKPIAAWILSLALLAGTARAQAPAYRADLNAVLSKLQSMGHGSYTSGEWSDVDRRLDDITRRAEGARDVDAAIDAQVIKAMVLSDMRGDSKGALDVLEAAKSRYSGRDAPAMRKVYVRETEIYGKLGDEGAVKRVMSEFKASPYYDPERYAYEGGEGRDTPLKIVRPSVIGSDSISVTAMEVARQRSQSAAGTSFPPFSLVDRSGKSVTLADCQGKVVLVDFWAQNWTPWRRDLASLKSTYARYHASGFDVLGINVERDSSDIASFLSKEGISWRQVADGTSLARQLGLFGEAANFLIDRSGVIVGRDLHGADLVAAVKRALEEK